VTSDPGQRDEQDGPTPPRPVAPGGRAALIVVLVAVAIGVLILDQVTKLVAVARLEGQPPMELIGDWLTLTFLRNPGAAFSLGTSSTVVFTIVAAIVVVVILRTARKLRSVWWAVALGALLGGAVGNLTDRLVREPGFPAGHVVDFISVKYFAVFNVADMAIVGSAILMVVLSVLGVELGGPRAEPDAADTGEPAPRDQAGAAPDG
jgi:signal peptidase II